MARIPVTQLQQSGGASELAFTACDAAANNMYNCGQEIVFLYGGTGTSGGIDVDFSGPTSADNGTAETLTVKCGSTSADNLSIVLNAEPLNWSAGGVNDNLVFTPADSSMNAVGVQVLTDFYQKTPVVFENITIGGAKLSDTVTGGDDPIYFANDGATIIVVQVTTATGTVQVSSTVESSDSGRIRTDSATTGTLNDIVVFGPRPVADFGGLLEFEMTSSGSTDCEVFAFSLLTGQQVPSA